MLHVACIPVYVRSCCVLVRFDMYVLHLEKFPCQMSVEMRLLIDTGSCLRILGGWLECLCMYNGSSLGFL